MIQPKRLRIFMNRDDMTIESGKCPMLYCYSTSTIKTYLVNRLV